MSNLFEVEKLIGRINSEADGRRWLFITYLLDDRDLLRESLAELDALVNHVWRISRWKRRRLRKRLLRPRERKLEFIEKVLSGTDLFGRRDDNEG